MLRNGEGLIVGGPAPHCEPGAEWRPGVASEESSVVKSDPAAIGQFSQATDSEICRMENENMDIPSGSAESLLTVAEPVNQDDPHGRKP